MLAQGISMAPYMVTLTGLPLLGFGGIILGITVLVGIPMKFWVAALVDNGMRLKKSLVITLVGMALITLAYIPSIYIGGWLLLCLRIAHGIALAVVLTLWNALTRLALGTDQGRLRKGFAIQSVVHTLSFGGFGALGLLLTTHPHLVLLAVALLVGIIAGKVQSLSLPQSSEKSTTKIAWSQTWKNIIIWEAITPGLVIFGVAVVYNSVMAYIADYADQHSFPAWGFIGTMTVMGVIARLGIDHITKLITMMMKRSDQIDLALSVGGIASFIVSIILLWWWPGAMTFIIAASLIGCGFSISFISLRVYTVSLVEENKKERATSTYFCLYDIGNVVGLAIGGLIWPLLFAVLILSLAILGWKWRTH